MNIKYSYFTSRPEKTKLQIIPGQLNITVECVPVDFSSKNLNIANKPKRLRLNLRVFILLMFIYFGVPGLIAAHDLLVVACGI